MNEFRGNENVDCHSAYMMPLQFKVILAAQREYLTALRVDTPLVRRSQTSVG